MVHNGAQWHLCANIQEDWYGVRSVAVIILLKHWQEGLVMTNFRVDCEGKICESAAEITYVSLLLFWLIDWIQYWQHVRRCYTWDGYVKKSSTTWRNSLQSGCEPLNRCHVHWEWRCYRPATPFKLGIFKSVFFCSSLFIAFLSPFFLENGNTVQNPTLPTKVSLCEVLHCRYTCNRAQSTRDRDTDICLPFSQLSPLDILVILWYKYRTSTSMLLARTTRSLLR